MWVCGMLSGAVTVLKATRKSSNRESNTAYEDHRAADSYCRRLRRIDTGARTNRNAVYRTARNIRPGSEVRAAVAPWVAAAL